MRGFGEAPELASGKRSVDWIYIDDLVDGLLALTLASDICGDSIDLGSGYLRPIREIVTQLVEQISPDIEPRFGVLPDRPMEQVRVADTAESYLKIGWKPQVSINSGLQQTVLWYEEFNGLSTHL